MKYFKPGDKIILKAKRNSSKGIKFKHNVEYIVLEIYKRAKVNFYIIRIKTTNKEVFVWADAFELAKITTTDNYEIF